MASWHIRKPRVYYLIQTLTLKKVAVFVFLFAVISITGNVVNSNTNTDCSGDGIYLYEHSDFGGACHKFINDQSDLSVLGFDDVVSSIRFVGSYAPWQYQVTLCEHADYEGDCSPFFIGDDPNLGDNIIRHDRTSSLRLKRIAYSDSIRIGTYNVQFLPTEFVTNGCCEDIPERVDKLAERILAAEYDILVLNEAFIDDIQDGLERRIREYYPHYIKYLDVDEFNFDQDSGLMLFSRYPFVPIENNPYPADDVIAYNGVAGRWNDVAFLQYEDFPGGCNNNTGDDCKADKGVAYVRIKNPITDRIYNIVFTHMDAGSTDGDINARRVNFEVTELLIRETLGDDFGTEDVFVLGDLNLNGDHAVSRSEWISYFGNPGTFFTDELRDAWEYELQSSMPSHLALFRDRGLTSNVPDLFEDPKRKRLDYILRNSPSISQPLCIQHMSIAYNYRHGEPYQEAVFADAGFQDLSDHYGVNADLNRGAPHCSPDKAYENPPLDSFLNGQITYPGSMQWYRIDPRRIGNAYVTGTYSIQVSSEGLVDFQVFKSNNLSVPLARQDGNTEAIGWTYHVINEPFYIRVFSKDRNWSGKYNLIIHKHEGTSKEDAISLNPNEYYGTYLASNETKWFQIHTDAPNSGNAQELRWGVAGLPGAATTALLELRAADGSTVLARQSASELSRSDIADNNTTLFLLVTNENSFNTPHFVGWSTNLTVLHGTLEQPLMLIALEPTEGGLGDDDEIKTLKIHADGNLVLDSGSLGHFDDNQIRGLGDVVEPIRFLEDLQLELIEEDDFLNPDDHMFGSVQPLGIEQALAYHRIDLTGDGGHYVLNVTLSHGLSFAYPRVTPLRGIYYLPILANNAGPDLVVEHVEITDEGVLIIIANKGRVAVTNPFWVDLYVDPVPIPTRVNQIWADGRSEFGLVWGVTAPIGVGGTLSLSIGDPYYWETLSNFPESLPVGTSVYVQVDSANTETNYGGVLEVHEIVGDPYNNIFGPIYSTPGNIQSSPPTLPFNEEFNGISGQLPYRP